MGGPRQYFSKEAAPGSDDKLVGVVVTIFSGTSYDEMFREVEPTTVPGERISTYSIGCADVKLLHDYLVAAMPVPEAWTSLIEDLQSVRPDSVIFNWECCSVVDDNGFPACFEAHALNFLVLSRGFTAMRSHVPLQRALYELQRPPVEHYGWLEKLSGNRAVGWQRRWVVLKAGILYSLENPSDQEPRRIVHLCNVLRVSFDETAFVVRLEECSAEQNSPVVSPSAPPGRTWQFRMEHNDGGSGFAANGENAAYFGNWTSIKVAFMDHIEFAAELPGLLRSAPAGTLPSAAAAKGAAAEARSDFNRRLRSGRLVVLVEGGPPLSSLVAPGAPAFQLPPDIQSKLAESGDDAAFEHVQDGIRSAYRMLSGSEATPELMNRVLANARVEAGIDVLVALGFPMQDMKSKYIIVVKKNCVRLLWYSYVLPLPTPGAVDGPFILRTATGNLAAADDQTGAGSLLQYELRRARRSAYGNMIEYLLGDASLKLDEL